MNRILSSAPAALVTGLAISALLLLVWVSDSSVDRLGFLSFILRWLHVLGGIIWVGMIWFVNFIQLAAIEQADDAGRKTLMKLVVPRVAAMFRHAAHLTLVSGILLLVATGYLFDQWVFLSAVYIAPLRSLLLWAGVLAGLAMWFFVQFIIWPNLQVVLGDSADAAAKAQARDRVRTFARINLILAIPVTFVMVAASHLY
jgi:uncharacterized membrane protein